MEGVSKSPFSPFSRSWFSESLPGLQWACPKVFKLLHLCDATGMLNTHHPLLESTLIAPGDDEGLPLCLGNMSRFFNCLLEMMLPDPTN